MFDLLQAPTADQVAGEIAGLAVLGLGALGAVLEQYAKRLLTPLNNASATIKLVVTFGWGVALAWLGGKAPWLAQALPADPGLLGSAINGILLAAVMMGAHSLKRVVERPESPDLSA